MTGFLCAAGIAGGAAFWAGWSSPPDTWWSATATWTGVALLAIAGIGGLARLVA